MLAYFLTKHKKLTMGFFLIANKLVNFLFISTALLGTDEMLGLGPLIVQGTALGGLFVAVVAPLFYNLISRGFTAEEQVTVNVYLSFMYIIFIVSACLGLVTESELVCMLVLGFSLAARGLCDPVISVEGLVIRRAIIALFFVEPIRWAIFFSSAGLELSIIALLIALPLLTDWLVRFDSLRKIPSNWISIFLRSVTSLKGDGNIKVAYKAIFVCQCEQIFLFCWAIHLSSQESLVYVFSIQVVGLLMLLFLPGWMELLRTSVGVGKSKKAQLMQAHAGTLYWSHFSAGVALMITLWLLEGFEAKVSTEWSIPAIENYIEQLRGIDTVTTLVVIVVIACFRSTFMDINLLATSDFYYKKMIVAQAAFVVGIILVLSNLVSPNPIGMLIVVYASAYVASALYHGGKYRTWLANISDN